MLLLLFFLVTLLLLSKSIVFSEVNELFSFSDTFSLLQIFAKNWITTNAKLAEFCQPKSSKIWRKPKNISNFWLKSTLWFEVSFTLTLELVFFLIYRKTTKARAKKYLCHDVTKAAIWGYLSCQFSSNVSNNTSK